MASPIEDAMLEALLRTAPEQYELVDGSGHASTIPARWGEFENHAKYIEPCIWREDNDSHQLAIYLYRAISVLTYRVDFLLELGVRKLAIECDGHEFHDRTKQQAAYDRARDRELLAIGIPTTRFTGSEIHHSAERCAREAYRCLLSIPDTRALSRDIWHEAICFMERFTERQVEEHW
jgi:very-short-patch-repair endonuclease